jgi:hypothetical protein
VKLGVHVGYWGLGMGPQDQLAVVQRAEADAAIPVAELAA